MKGLKFNDLALRKKTRILVSSYINAGICSAVERSLKFIIAIIEHGLILFQAARTQNREKWNFCCAL
jgi:hypothetical protein